MPKFAVNVLPTSLYFLTQPPSPSRVPLFLLSHSLHLPSLSQLIVSIYISFFLFSLILSTSLLSFSFSLSTCHISLNLSSLSLHLFFLYLSSLSLSLYLSLSISLSLSSFSLLFNIFSYSFTSFLKVFLV